MFRTLTAITSITLVLPLLGAGCGSSTDVSYATYSVGIETSSQQKEVRQATIAESETDINRLLDEVGVQAETATRGSDTAITKLNGVISTLSNEWHLYINNTLQTFTQLDHVPVRASDTIEWKYESTSNKQ